jgi:hypothetical protein
VRESDREFGLKHGHSPMADKVIAVDFDSTIVRWAVLDYEHKRALPGAAPAIRELKKRGYKIVIHTSRLSSTWCRKAGESVKEQRAFVAETLDRLGIPYDKITAEKLPCEWYIDDRAIGFRGDWNAVMQEIG